MRDDEEDSIYDFWNKLPGRGVRFLCLRQDSPRRPLWEAVRIGVTEYLGERWVVESVDKDNVVVRRTDQPLAYRLKQTFRTPGGELNYAMWTTRDIPEDMGFTYMVGSGCFQKAIQRDLGIPVGVSANLGQSEAEVTGGELKTAVSLGDAPNANQTGLVARWFIWSILALQWVGESIEANRNP